MTSVLLVNLSRSYGGADARVRHLARRLGQNGDEVQVAVLAGSDVGRHLRSDGATVIELPYGKADPRLGWELRRRVRAGRIEVVDSHNPQSQFWTYLATIGLGVGRVSTVHSIYRDEHAGRLRGRVYEWLLRLERDERAGFIAVSDSVAEHLRGAVGLAGRAVTVVPNALPPRKRTASDLITLLGWGSNQIVTAVGRLEAVKGHDILVRAVALLSDRYPDLRCLIVGEGSRHDALADLVAELGLDDRVHLAGFRDDVGELLAASAVFAQPSHTEGMPFSLLEAMAAGVPVVASAVGGMRSLRDGVDGLLIAPGDTSALATAIETLLDNEELSRRLSATSAQRLAEEHSPEAMLAGTIGVYRQAMRERRRDR
jgi:L-malate glycosyltransferase